MKQNIFSKKNQLDEMQEHLFLHPFVAAPCFAAVIAVYHVPYIMSSCKLPLLAFPGWLCYHGTSAILLWQHRTIPA